MGSEMCIRDSTNVDEISDEERSLAALEEDADFVVPEPPADDAQDEDPDEEEDLELEDGVPGEDINIEADADGAAEAPAGAPAGASAEAPAAAEVVTDTVEPAAATTEGADAPKES